jgi:D-aminoacyl-tRNA deacylase
MYGKYLVIASKKDKAGMNIINQLPQFGQHNFYLVDEEIIYTENLDLGKIGEYDFIIFASKHESIRKEKTISIHAPGNWKEAKLGGKEGKVCRSSALFQKRIFEELNRNIQEYNLEKYSLTLECTHHGPLIDKPCIFIEIGSTETEWKDSKAGFVIAKSLAIVLKNFKYNPYNEIAIGIGGPHYCPKFNKLQLISNIAISHIIPQYALPINEEIIREVIRKTEEEVDFMLLDWKGLGKLEQRQQVLEILDKLYIRYKKTTDIKF